MSSFRQLLAEGNARRADAVRTWIGEIHFEPDFNVPESAEDYEARVEGMVAHLANGGKLPAIEVRDRPEGGVAVVDGHARTDAYQRAHDRGIPVADPKDGRVYLMTTLFEGNDAARTLRLITSAEGRTLTPLQMANVITRLRNFGWGADDIAKKINRSTERVRQLLELGDANSDVQALVKSGQVSESVATAAVRKHGDSAGTVLADQLTQVQAAGGKKLTPGKAGAKKPKVGDLAQEKAMLDWLVDQRAMVARGSKEDFAADSITLGYWVFWPGDGRTQPGLFKDPREAVTQAMKKEPGAQVLGAPPSE